jgi:hypothetical protein
MSNQQSTDPRFSVVYEDCGKYLYAAVTGRTDTAEISIAYWNAVAAECRSRGFKRLLVTEHFETAPALAEVFEVTSRLPEIIRGLVVAFVDEVLTDWANNQFGENVAVNRGAIGRLFKDVESATAWLNSDNPT